ncbi:hypothetical protein C3492_35890 [Streptomyces sp. Ru62]|nr:hypothetical protein C3492_35890 [Streptomyces sp. Ru62]
MNCFDCTRAYQAGTTNISPDPAVAACARCGAGVCGRHAHVTPDPLALASGSGTASPSARRITCDVCHPAESAAAAG